MGRKRTVNTQSGDTPTLITIYVTERLKKEIETVAKELGFKGNSDFLRSLVIPVLDKYHKGEIKAPDTNIELLEAELKEARKKEAKFLDEFRKPSKLPGKTFYQLLVAFAIRNGSTSQLEGDIAGVLAKLRTLKLVGNEGFDLSTKLDYCNFLEAIIKRRELSVQIDEYMQAHTGGGEAPPLEAPMITAL